MFSSIDDVIKQRTPAALSALSGGLADFNRYSAQAINNGIKPLNRIGQLEAEDKINNLMGLNGGDAQRVAIGNINVSDFDKELQRRQLETTNRSAFANGDVSGASMLNSIQLSGQHQSDNITKRLNELSPLADMARQARTRQSEIIEAGRTNMAAQDMAYGTQRANVRLGGVAPLIQNNLQAANMSGLQRIGAANERGNIASSLAGAAGQYLNSQPQSQPINAYAGFQNPVYNQSYYQPADTASANYTTNYSGYA